MYAIPDREFYLTMRLLAVSFEEGIFTRGDFDPVHTYNLRQNWTASQKTFHYTYPCVYHETQDKWDVAFVSRDRSREQASEVCLPPLEYA
jgi:hypothetical protein